MSKIEDYVRVDENYEVPSTMRDLVLSGREEKNLKIKRIDVPECGEQEILARVDAAIACASDIKLIDQGSEHPLMYGWDVSKYPIIIGHEGAVTIVKVGEKLKEKHHVGERFVVQSAVPCGPHRFKERYRNNAVGINKIAVGYTLPGLFAEYVLIPQEVIETGCLIPFPEKEIPYFAGALAEPLSDVIAAQERMVHIVKDSPTSPRRAEIGPKRGGVTLIIGAGPMGLIHIEIAMSYKPREIIISELIERRRERARRLFQEKANKLGIRLVITDPENLERVINKETDGKGVDDVIVALGIAKIQEESLKYLAPGGVANFFGGTKFDERFIKVDTHRIHYDGITAVGSSGSDPSDIAKVLDMIAEGLIDPGNYIVKCGGMGSALSLIQAVRRKEIDGKGVIYPHAESDLFDAERWSLQKEVEFLESHLITR